MSSFGTGFHEARELEGGRVPQPGVVRFSRPSQTVRLRLFCLPYAGGNAWMFRTWPQALPSTVEVCAVELPGRGSRLLEPPHTRLLLLVRDMAEAILPYLDRPFVLFGHSMGALISFELARQLRDQYSLRPGHLFVSARRAPHIPEPDPPIHSLPEPHFVDEVRSLNGVSDEVLRNEELMQVIIPILRADFEMCETYTYIFGAPLNCPISAFGGVGDSETQREDLEAWRDQTTATFTLRMFPGDHFFLHSAQSTLLQGLCQELERLAAF